MTFLRDCDCWTAHCKHNPGPKIREVWGIYNNGIFDRIIFCKWWFYRQQCFMDVETDKVTWRDVPMFGKGKQK